MIARVILPEDYENLLKMEAPLSLYAKNIKRWIEEKYIKEDDCFVFDGDKGIAGGVCFCDDAEELLILDFAIIESCEAAVHYLLDAINLARKMEGRKSSKISYNLCDDTTQYADIKKIFETAGFIVAQEKARYIYKNQDELPKNNIGLDFKSVAEIGEVLFADVFAEATKDTLDSLMARDIEHQGMQKITRDYIESMKQIDFDADWWRVGFAGGVPVGLVLPQKFSDSIGCINYIGVVAEHRGRGYGLPLLLEGSRILLDAGTERILADIDIKNSPLKTHLEQVGYIFSEEMAVLELSL